MAALFDDGGPPDRGPAVFAVVTATLCLSTLFVTARMISRVGIVRNVSWDDAMIIVAWLFSMSLCVAIDFGTHKGLGRFDKHISESDRPGLRMSEYVFSVLYNPALMATKSSILIFYLRLAKNTHKILRMASWIVLSIVLTAGTILTFMNIFQCHPIMSAWDIHVKSDRCISLLTEFICSAPVNVTTDLAIMALPIPVITSMRLPPRQKTILVITFALGFFITVVDVVRIYYLQQAITEVPVGASADPDAIYSQSDNFSWNASLSLMWSAVEVNVGITCACIPTLKPLIIRILPAMIVDPKGTRRTSAPVRSAPVISDSGTKPASSDNSQPDNTATTPVDLIMPAPPVASADPERQSADELSLRGFLSGLDGGNDRANAYGARQNGGPLSPRPRVQSTASTVSDRPFYFGFVNVKKPKSMIRTSALESFKYCTVVSILFFLWGISYGLLNTLNTVVAEVANMTEAQTLGLTSLYFGGGYFFGPLLVGEWLLRHDEHHRSRKRGLGEPQSVGGFKATFIIGLLIYGTGTIMFWPGAVLASYGGFMVSGLVVGFGLAVLETAANPFIVLCGPPEYADTRLLLAQGVQGIGSVLSGLLANNVFFSRIETRGVNSTVSSTTLLDVQWTYLAITLFCVLLAFYFYYMPLPEVTDRELERLAARLPVDPHRRLFGKRLSLSGVAIALAVLSQWTYMAAQENMSIFFHDLLTAFAPLPSDSSSSSPRSTYQPPGFPISVLNYLLVAHTAFAVSRFVAGALAYLSVTYPRNRFLPTPRTILSASVGFSALSVLAAVVMRPTKNPNLIAIPIISFFLFEGPIWPLVFSMGLRGQGARTKRAAAWLTMGGSGPAFWPFVGWAIVRGGGSIQTSFVVVVALMAVAGGYPLFLTFVGDARKMVDATLVEGEGGGGEKPVHAPLERTRSEGAEVTMDMIIESRRREAERRLNGEREGERGLRRLTGTWGRYKERRESGIGNHGGDVVAPPQQQQGRGDQNLAPTKDIKPSVHLWHVFKQHIFWRILAALISMVLVLCVLYGFSRKDSLTGEDRRWLNTLAILFSALVSLSVGSLLNFLGTMIRWQLLASRPHSALDADLILGMSDPAGAFHLTWCHTKELRWTGVTAVALLYMVVNVGGRLSVAAFGLTFDLDEVSGIEYPVVVANWNASQLADAPSLQTLSSDSFPYTNRFQDAIEQLEKQTTIGLVSAPSPSGFQGTSPFSTNGNNGLYVNEYEQRDTVSYSYHLREIQGTVEVPSKDLIIRSTSRCAMRGRLGKYGLYQPQANDTAQPLFNITTVVQNSIPKYDFDAATAPEYVQMAVHILNSIYQRSFPENTLPMDTFWAAQLDGFGALRTETSACAITYLLSGGSPDSFAIPNFSPTTDLIPSGYLMDCSTCLTDQHGNPAFPPGLLRGLAPSSATFAANTLLHLGTYQIWKKTPPAATNKTLSIKRHPWQSKDVNIFGDRTSRPESPRFVSQTELYTAHITARLPLLTLVGADISLPKVSKIEGAAEHPFTSITLGVRWGRAIGVLAAILAGEVLAVGIVCYFCRNVLVRDHGSYLSVAALLKPALEAVPKGDVRSVDGGLEIAERMRGVEMRYRTVKTADGCLEVGLLHRGSGIVGDGRFVEGKYR
ncbi:hypothetical protein QBC39DRAFT_370122 [Podospora conica]|nr:hypothetical protein QBC39DRAFT_370122 [Schizothecium conicum]